MPEPDMVALLGLDLTPYRIQDTGVDASDPGTAALLEIFARHDIASEDDWPPLLTEAFIGFADWLASLSAAPWEERRAEGYRMDVMLFYWLDDQMLDISLPPQLMAQLGRLHLPLEIYTEGFG